MRRSTPPGRLLVFIDPDDKAYLSITARACVQHDPAKIKSVWKKSDELWWRGPTDPRVCLLRIEPVTAELWDGPASRVVTLSSRSPREIDGRAAEPRREPQGDSRDARRQLPWSEFQQLSSLFL
jgi:hypothetical protein